MLHKQSSIFIEDEHSKMNNFREKAEEYYQAALVGTGKNQSAAAKKKLIDAIVILEQGKDLNANDYCNLSYYYKEICHLECYEANFESALKACLQSIDCLKKIDDNTIGRDKYAYLRAAANYDASVIYYKLNSNQALTHANYAKNSLFTTLKKTKAHMEFFAKIYTLMKDLYSPNSMENYFYEFIAQVFLGSKDDVLEKFTHIHNLMFKNRGFYSTVLLRNYIQFITEMQRMPMARLPYFSNCKLMRVLNNKHEFRRFNGEIFSIIDIIFPPAIPLALKRKKTEISLVPNKAERSEQNPQKKRKTAMTELIEKVNSDSDSNSSSLQAKVGESSNSLSVTGFSELTFFSPLDNDDKKSHEDDVKIKLENEEIGNDIDLDKMIDYLRSVIKQKRDGNNALDNCAYIVKYTISALSNLLQGKPAPEEEITTESSINTSSNLVLRKYVPIKSENGIRIRRQLRVVSSESIISNIGLESILPYKMNLYTDLTSCEDKEIVEIDLEATAIPRIKAKSHDINKILMDKAKESNTIIIGQIALAGIGRRAVGHVLAFCASATKIFFIDGQRYNGISKMGDPIYTDLNSTYSFATQKETSCQGYFADDIFYLIHEEFPVKSFTPASSGMKLSG